MQILTLSFILFCNSCSVTVGSSLVRVRTYISGRRSISCVDVYHIMWWLVFMCKFFMVENWSLQIFVLFNTMTVVRVHLKGVAFPRIIVVMVSWSVKFSLVETFSAAQRTQAFESVTRVISLIANFASIPLLASPSNLSATQC